MRGEGLGGPKFLCDHERGSGWVEMARRGWVMVRKRGSASSGGMSMIPAPPTAVPPTSGFGEPGPLSELLQQARSTLRRLEGIEGQPEPEETRTSKGSGVQL